LRRIKLFTAASGRERLDDTVLTLNLRNRTLKWRWRRRWRWWW